MYTKTFTHSFHKFISVSEESNNWECFCSQLDGMLVHCRVERDEEIMTAPGPGFSKVPRLFGRILGDIILFVSSKRRRPEVQNFAVILIFIPYTNIMKRSALQNERVVVLRMAFRARKVFRTFEKWAPILKPILES